MPEQTFGGDDDSSGQQPQAQQPKKLDLKKFASRPDANVRDIFWQVMGSYAVKKSLDSAELKAIEEHKIALLRIAESEIARGSSYQGLGKNSVAYYTLMLCLDAGWNDLAKEFLGKTYDMHKEADKAVSLALGRLYQEGKYKDAISAIFTASIRNNMGMEAAIAYLSAMKNKEAVKTFKKELMIIARNDVESNQHNAIIALASIMQEDSEIKTMMLSLLSHWDEETRFLISSILREAIEAKVVEAAKRQLIAETDGRVREVLEKIINVEDVLSAPRVSEGVKKLKKSIEKMKKARSDDDGDSQDTA